MKQKKQIAVTYRKHVSSHSMTTGAEQMDCRVVKWFTVGHALRGLSSLLNDNNTETQISYLYLVHAVSRSNENLHGWGVLPNTTNFASVHIRNPRSSTRLSNLNGLKFYENS